MRKPQKNEAQLSLFENNEPLPSNKKPTTIVDFARARFEQNPDMDQEEYKRWIKFLIHTSLKSMDK